jgi:hypothetical protein
VAQTIALFQMRCDQDQTKAERGDPQRVTGLEPDRRREMRKTANHDGVNAVATSKIFSLGVSRRAFENMAIPVRRRSISCKNIKLFRCFPRLLH